MEWSEEGGGWVDGKMPARHDGRLDGWHDGWQGGLARRAGSRAMTVDV